VRSCDLADARRLRKTDRHHRPRATFDQAQRRLLALRGVDDLKLEVGPASLLLPALGPLPRRLVE
jgi:hypothetical protein